MISQSALLGFIHFLPFLPSLWLWCRFNKKNQAFAWIIDLSVCFMKNESAIFYSFRVLSLNVKWSPLHVERASPSGCWQNCSPHLILHVSKVSITPVSCLHIGSFRIFLYNHSLIYKYLVYHFSCFNRSCFMSTGHRMLFSIVCSSQNWWKGCSIDVF